MKFLVLGASLRKDSYNVKLSHLVEDILRKEKVEVVSPSFNSFEMPLFNEDLQNKEGIPAGISKYAEELQAADAWIICSPEYNFSVPGTVKNFVDWLSRVQPVPFNKKQIFLLSASPALAGGVRGLWHLRVPLEGCGGFVYPQMFSVSKAHEAFNEKGQLAEASTFEKLEWAIKDFKNHVEKILGSS